jgi:GntR family transcriptional regulator
MLMRANEDPMAVLNSYWPLKIGETIAKYDLTAAGIFSVAEKILGIKLSEAEGTLEAAAPSREEVLLLQMPKRTPVLVKEQVIYSADGYPINYYRITYRGDRYKFRIRAIRHPVQNVIANREVIAFSNPSNPGFTETV